MCPLSENASTHGIMTSAKLLYLPVSGGALLSIASPETLDLMDI